MRLDIPARNGGIVKWRDIELRRVDHHGKPLTRTMFSAEHAYQLLGDMVASAQSGYQK
jgi:hypothetical protein